MKLTPLEIKQQKFEKTFRGYDPAEVDAFLKLMSNEWEHLVGKNRELERQINELREKLEHYERVEEALHETLQTAKQSAETKLAGARKEADRTIDKAEMEAEKIVREAKQERLDIRRNIRRLLDRRKEIVAGIRSYLEVAKESVEQFSEDKTGLYDQPEEPEKQAEKEEKEGASENREETGRSKTEEKEYEITSPRPTPAGPEDIDELVDDLE